MVHIVTDETFDTEVRDSEVPCVIEFTAGWCTLCDEMVPVFEELSEKMGDKVKFCIVNTDENRALRIKFAVAALPYIVYVFNGEAIPLFDELVTAKRLEDRIDHVLNGGDTPNARPL